MKPALVLRPEPGNARTCARLVAAGIAATALPLFAIRPLAWIPPDPQGFDAVLLTSASALRHGGEGLRVLRVLPALAVGEATASAARAAGFVVALVGHGDAATVLAAARNAGFTRPLHLAGREHRPTGATTVPVYASEPVAIPGDTVAMALAGTDVTLLHSPRAARRFAELVDAGRIPRRDRSIAALSPAVLAAAGTGWGWAAAAPVPTDAALVALVRERLTGPVVPRISGA